MEKRMNWNYTTEFDVLDYVGFVYEITGNGRCYIGKKNFYKFRTPKGKKNKVKSESNWKNYWSSCDELKADIKLYGKDVFTRNILVLCETKRQMTYVETALQFKLDVLMNDSYYNTNISGKFYHWFDC